SEGKGAPGTGSPRSRSCLTDTTCRCACASARMWSSPGDVDGPRTERPNLFMTNATQTPHVNLKTLPSNGYVDGVYSIINPQVGTTKGGKPYLKCLLRDATGECAARQWTFDES